MPSILLVEDEELLRTTLTFLLTGEGYEVLEASDGQEAVDLFIQQPDAIDLVLSDLMMPRLNGLEMFRILKEVRPQVKLILITGMLNAAPAWREQGVHDLIAKPFEITHLLNKVAMAFTI